MICKQQRNIELERERERERDGEMCQLSQEKFELEKKFWGSLIVRFFRVTTAYGENSCWSVEEGTSRCSRWF